MIKFFRLHLFKPLKPKESQDSIKELISLGYFMGTVKRPSYAGLKLFTNLLPEMKEIDNLNKLKRQLKVSLSIRLSTRWRNSSATCRQT